MSAVELKNGAETRLRAPQQPENRRKAVVVHAGARDAYQLSVALSEAGLLDVLVTDLYFPADRGWAQWLLTRLPASLRELALRRTTTGLPSSKVRMRIGDGLRLLLFERVKQLPFPWKRWSIRAADADLGKDAGRRARTCGQGLVSYSYTGYDAIRAFGGPAMLFQAHPHPETVRRLLREELEAHPDCADSLLQEWELSLPEEDYNHLVEEPKLATRFLVASSFTRDSLVEHGAVAESITVVPYGVDLERFQPTPSYRPSSAGEPLRLLFVGRINQRKGIKYLLEALRLLEPGTVHLTVCGRVVDDLSLFKPFADQVTIRPSVTGSELIEAYQQADLFVFPSVVEGFAQVLLESLACGLPILSTTHTAAPDLIDDGVEGFIVEPRRADQLADRIRWAIAHRAELGEMHTRARQRAETYTWQRFRARVAEAVGQYLDSLA